MIKTLNKVGTEGIYFNIVKDKCEEPTASIIQFSSIAQSCPTLATPWIAERPPFPSPTPGVYSNSFPSSQWCHPAVSSSVVPFSSCPQSLPASGSFLMSQLFAWGGQSTRAFALNRSANKENSAVATELETVSFYSNSKEGQCQQMFKLPNNFTHFTC